MTGGEHQERAAEPDAGLTRRQVLRKAAILGGSIWAVPIVQVVTMQPAFAQTTSGPTTDTTPPNGEPPNGQEPPNGGGETQTGGGQESVDGGKTASATDPGDTDVLGVKITQPGSTQTQQPVAVAAVQQTQETIPKTGIEALEMGALGAGLVGAGWAAVVGAKHSDPDSPAETRPLPEDPEPIGV